MAEIIEIDPVPISISGKCAQNLMLRDLSFSFTYPTSEENTKVINYLMTVPEEWDLFVRQCIEKYGVK